MNKILGVISKFVGWILRFIAEDLYDSRDNSLKELNEITKDKGLTWTNKQTNDCLALLNKNIINLNCSTSIYSRVLTIFTFIILILTVVMIFKSC